jgi:hypothetical protein
MAAWCTMNCHPATRSVQTAWMRLLDDSAGGSSDAGRLMTTDAIRLADTRKLTTSIQ